MNTKCFSLVKAILFSTIVILITSGLNNACAITGVRFVQIDTSSVKFKEFKKFTVQYFKAVKTKDTVFLKAHTIFPIIDFPLSGKKKIDQSYFCKNLDKLFPSDLTDQISKNGEFLLSTLDNGTKYGKIGLTVAGKDADMRYDWIFIVKKGVYYLSRFTAEMG